MARKPENTGSEPLEFGLSSRDVFETLNGLASEEVRAKVLEALSDPKSQVSSVCKRLAALTQFPYEEDFRSEKGENENE